jgi:hypothetical protein
MNSISTSSPSHCERGDDSARAGLVMWINQDVDLPQALVTAQREGASLSSRAPACRWATIEPAGISTSSQTPSPKG